MVSSVYTSSWMADFQSKRLLFITESQNSHLKVIISPSSQPRVYLHLPDLREWLLHSFSCLDQKLQRPKQDFILLVLPLNIFSSTTFHYLYCHYPRSIAIHYTLILKGIHSFLIVPFQNQRKWNNMLYMSNSTLKGMYSYLFSWIDLRWEWISHFYFLYCPLKISFQKQKITGVANWVCCSLSSELIHTVHSVAFS